MKIVRDRKFETEVIRRHLSEAKVGDQISFDVLSRLTGMKITSTSAPFTSARRIVLNEDNIVFDSVRGVGVRRIGDEEISTVHSDKDITRSRRHAKRAVKKLACVENFASMSNHAQISHVIKSSFFGAVAYMAHKSRLQNVAAAASGRSSELPVKETLKAFIGG
jgi:hypothetical protein